MEGGGGGERGSSCWCEAVFWTAATRPAAIKIHWGRAAEHPRHRCHYADMLRYSLVGNNSGVVVAMSEGSVENIHFTTHCVV